MFHDLYKENFSPILLQEEYEETDLNKLSDHNVIKYCEELQESDIVVIVHPNWWGQPPTLLKGWVDRVFRRGVAYKYITEGKVQGLLKAKFTYIINTSNTPEEIEKQVYGDPLTNLWDACVFKMVASKVYKG